MKIGWKLVGHGVASVVIVAACLAQKPDNWAIQNAQIGPESPIEVRAGSSYEAQVMYPVPDGPLFPLKAQVEWSIAAPVKGISIDAKTGKITVDAGVPHGTTATIRADVNHGVRKLTGKLVVFSPAENPLVGSWTVKSALGCGDTQQILPAEAVGRLERYWSFHTDQTVWIGQPIGIAAGVKLSGTYEFDLQSGKLTLTPTWPKGKAPQEWKFELVSAREMKVVSVQPKDDKSQVCGYVLSQTAGAVSP
jgi:hypothetical protein